MTTPINVNGSAYSWGHMKPTWVQGSGIVYTAPGLTAVSYSESLEVAKGTVIGANRAPTRRSQGEYSADDATISGFMRDIQELLAALAASGLGSYGATEFTIPIVYANPFEPVFSDTLHRCRVIGVGQSYSVGPDLLQMDLTLSVMSISRTGGTTLHQRF